MLSDIFYPLRKFTPYHAQTLIYALKLLHFIAVIAVLIVKAVIIVIISIAFAPLA